MYDTSALIAIRLFTPRGQCGHGLARLVGQWLPVERGVRYDADPQARSEGLKAAQGVWEHFHVDREDMLHGKTEEITPNNHTRVSIAGVCISLKATSAIHLSV